MDAPQLKGNKEAMGIVKTMPVNGAYEIVGNDNKVINASDYVKRLLANRNREELK